MTTNALLIEFGATGVMDDEAQKAMGNILGTLDGWKSDGSIEDFRFYPVVTGNRTERAALIVVEVSHEQLEALVVKKSYGELMEELMAVGTNVTTNRAITIQRMLQLMKEMR